MDRIDLDEEKPTNTNEEQDSSSELENNENIDPDVDEIVPIYKAININNETKLCNICVKSKHIKIVKLKRMTSTIQRL